MEHCGSTAVPGLASKPIVDILLREVEALKPDLAVRFRDDRVRYTAEKGHFIRKVLAAAGR